MKSNHCDNLYFTMNKNVAATVEERASSGKRKSSAATINAEKNKKKKKKKSATTSSTPPNKTITLQKSVVSLLKKKDLEKYSKEAEKRQHDIQLGSEEKKEKDAKQLVSESCKDIEIKVRNCMWPYLSKIILSGDKKNNLSHTKSSESQYHLSQSVKRYH